MTPKSLAESKIADCFCINCVGEAYRPCNHIEATLRSRGSLARAPRAAFSSQLRCRDEAAPRALIHVSRPSQVLDEGPPPAAAEPRARAAAAAKATQRIRFERSSAPTWARSSALRLRRARSRRSHGCPCARARPGAPRPTCSRTQHVGSLRELWSLAR